MLSVNLPFCGSSTCSALAVSTLYNDIFPSCEPEICNKMFIQIDSTAIPCITLKTYNIFIIW